MRYMTNEDRLAHEESLLEGAIVAAALEWSRARRAAPDGRPLLAEARLDSVVQDLERFLGHDEPLCAV